MSDDLLVVRRNISLYPEHDAAVEALNDAKGLHNYSAALRQIIHEWALLRGGFANSIPQNRNGDAVSLTTEQAA